MFLRTCCNRSSAPCNSGLITDLSRFLIRPPVDKSHLRASFFHGSRLLAELLQRKSFASLSVTCMSTECNWRTLSKMIFAISSVRQLLVVVRLGVGHPAPPLAVVETAVRRPSAPPSVPSRSSKSKARLSPLHKAPPHLFGLRHLSPLPWHRNAESASSATMN